MASTSDATGLESDHLIAAIDQGTTSTRFFVFNSKAQVISYYQMEFEQIKPKAGCVMLNDTLNVIYIK